MEITKMLQLQLDLWESGSTLDLLPSLDEIERLVNLEDDERDRREMGALLETEAEYRDWL